MVCVDPQMLLLGTSIQYKLTVITVIVMVAISTNHSSPLI